MSLSNNDYQDIMRQYEERRLSNYRLHEQRKKDIYTTIPEIKELDRQITANSISLGKQLIIRDDPALRGIPHKESGADQSETGSLKRSRVFF